MSQAEWSLTARRLAKVLSQINALPLDAFVAQCDVYLRAGFVRGKRRSRPMTPKDRSLIHFIETVAHHCSRMDEVLTKRALALRISSQKRRSSPPCRTRATTWQTSIQCPPSAAYYGRPSLLKQAQLPRHRTNEN